MIAPPTGVPCQREISPNLITEGAGKMIPIKSAHRTEIQDLEAMAAKLLETARKLPAGQDRHNALQEIERFRARILPLFAHHRGLSPNSPSGIGDRES